MSFQKLSAWFLTKTGQKVVFGLATTASIGVLFGHTLPNVFYIDKYKDIVHLYKDGFTVPLTQELTNRFEKTLKLLEIREEDHKHFKPFMVFGFDPFSAGTAYSQYGSIIGLPVNFTYETVDDVDKNEIKINGESGLWGTEEGKKLSNSLVLSENAQMYAMAREIRMKQTPKFLIDTANASFSCAAIYGFSNYINVRLNLYSRAFGLRLIMYSLVTLFVGGNYALVKDFSQMFYEERIDKELNKIPVLAEGGKEYYAKIIERNKALRVLWGKLGESKYSALGNENYLIRQRHLPLDQRKSIFEPQVKAAL